MDKTKFGTYHLASNPNNYEVARDNDFTFVVTGIDNILKAGYDETDENAFTVNAQNNLEYSVVSASIPNFTQEALTINRGNSTIKFAGKPTFGNGTLVVNDFVGIDTKSYLMAWQRLSYDVVTDTVGKAADYKKTCYLMEYDVSYNLVRTWKLVGCWISAISENEYTTESSGKKTISATIEYDRAYVEF